MFRDMRRFKQQIPEEECLQILKETRRGVLAVCGDEGYPYAMPMNFVYVDGRIYFHSALEGHRMDAITQNEKVSFCVMDQGYREDGDWAWYVKSVIVFGRLKIVDDQEQQLEKLRALGEKYFPETVSLEEEMKSAGRAHCLELTIEHMTGKLVHEN